MKRVPWWRPTYTVRVRKHDGVIPVGFSLDEPALSECPRSYVTQESLDLVQIVTTFQSVHQATGSAVAVEGMPGYLVDAIRVCAREGKTIDYEQDEAVSRA